jgi:hypothetical protein
MSKQNIPPPLHSRDSLVEWLKLVVTTLAIHTRAEWGHVLGVTPQAIGTWLNGEKLPRADALRDLLSTLEQRYAERAKPALADWKVLAMHPLHEVWPGVARGDTRTLGHYVVGPLWEDLRLAVESQTPEMQARLLKTFIAEINEHRLGERGRRLGREQLSNEAALRRGAPKATQANPGLVSMMSSAIQRGSVLDFSGSPPAA